MNILLCCSAGMSTSLLVQKMQKAAEEMGIEGKIWAVSVDDVPNHIGDADVLLLGPQVRYQLADFKELGKEKGIPVDMINPVDYGMVNGKKVMEFALKLVK